MGSNTTPEPQYTVFRVPVASPRIDDFVAKFRETRLAGIKADTANSFLAYEVEAEHPSSVWHARLFGGITSLVCVADADPTLSVEDALLSGTWAGFVFLKERLTSEEYYGIPNMALEMPEDSSLEARFHVFDLFISPDHRRRSAASTLVESSLAAIKEITLSEGSGTKKARVRMIMNPKNTWILGWYRRLGFVDRGTSTVVQGFLANGFGASIPEDTESTEELRSWWHAPIGLVMEGVMDFD